MMAKTLRDTMWGWGTMIDVIGNETELMSPVEGADYMGIKNFLMCGGAPATDEQAAPAAARGGRIVWEMEAGFGSTFGENFEFQSRLDRILPLAQRFPNIEGVLLDDLSTITIGQEKMPPEVLGRICRALQSEPRPLSLWGVIYTMSYDDPALSTYIEDLPEYLKYLDVINLWVWHAKDLHKLEANLERCNELSGGKPVHLGLYLYDFGDGRPMPLDLMEMQCETARRWVHEGEIIGMGFLPTSAFGRGIEAAEWAAEWARKVGDEPL